MPPLADLDSVHFPNWLNTASRYGDGEDALVAPAPNLDLDIDWSLVGSPHNFASALRYANLRFFARRYYDALIDYEVLVNLRSIMNDARRARVYYNIGIVKMHMDKPGEAIQAFQMSFACDPSLYAPVFARGCILWSLNMYREAWDTFNAADRIFNQRHADHGRPPKPPIADRGLDTAFHHTKLLYNISLVRSKLPDPPAGEEEILIYELHPMDRSKVFESDHHLAKGLSTGQGNHFGSKAKELGKDFRESWKEGMARIIPRLH